MPQLNRTQRIAAILHFKQPQFNNIRYKYEVVARELKRKFTLIFRHVV